MKAPAVFAILILAALLSPPVVALDIPAVVSYSFVPSNPTENDIVRFRMDVNGCFHHPFGAYLVSGEATIEARITGEDFPCDPSALENMATPRFYDVGQLSAGVYATRVVFCVPGPPDYICDTLQQGTLVVSGTPRSASTVPALSLPGLGMLVLLAVGAAWVVLGRR